jgi:nucleotide-binding universal stress UspA family protein
LIVVGVDGSSGAREALRYAVREARAKGDRLRVVSVWHVPVIVYSGGLTPGVCPAAFSESATTAVDEAVEGLGEEAEGVEIEQVVREGETAEVLIDEAKGADLLVVGSRGLGGFRGLLLGSVSQACAHHAPCPIVIVRGKEKAGGSAAGR